MFTQILFTVIVPVFIIIGIGMIMERAFKLDQPTLSKLNFYAFVPALSFVKIVEMKFTASELGLIVLFSAALAAILFVIAYAVSLHPAIRNHRTVFMQESIFTNCGNFGLPFIALSVGPDAVAVMAIIIIFQNILTFTLGVWMFERKRTPLSKIVSGLLKIPVLYAVVVGGLLHYLSVKAQISIPEPVMIPLRYLSDGLIPLALLTLGTELSRSRFSSNIGPLAAIGFLRLVLSPAIAMVMILAFNIPDPLSRILLYAAGFPVAVNVFIMAAEYKQDAEFASQSIFWSTLASAVTLSALVALYR